MATLDPAYELATAVPADRDELFRMMEVAYYNDAVWKHARMNVRDEDLHVWFMKFVAPRWDMPDTETFKIVDRASGRIIAWTALQYPWKQRPAMTKELQNQANDHTPPSDFYWPEGFFIPPWEAFLEVMYSANSHDYNPEEDYHRKGTMVHPAYQKQGLGTILTQHTNSISARTGGRTWAPARPSSYKMFLNEGFRDVAVIDNQTERWGGTREEGLNYLLRRDEGVVGA
ncbi:hypothetical protein HYFRA_00012928 [Hymenoscyphus fraxineus]|uniref:N-acetyltransferase domain-containing protein n=1 Tax=Hymenoscyphus fraxineus TaxID=746836 RepID=A0A9N9L2W9_9HELO|nr:hypothetical protein HYFRA_00012928 [Hymenoscyphus fraxineus]